jgi:RHS repeat-associated protein
MGSLISNKRDASGQLFMRNRYYDPESGRFTQEDPIGIAGGLNLYGFADGDPVNSSDPFGLCPPINLCAGILGGAVFGGVRVASNAIHDRPLLENVARDAAVGFVAGFSFGAAVPAIARAGVAIGAAATSGAALPAGVARTFQDGTIRTIELADDLPVTRVFGGMSKMVGRFFSNQSFLSGDAARSALQLPKENAATQIVQGVVPKGTTIFQGVVRGSPTNAVQIFLSDPTVVRFGGARTLH